MAMDWMSTVQPLDLLSPLERGEQLGVQQAYRQDQIKVEAAREADMKARLGLEQNAQNFQQSVWQSGQQMRDAQLSLVQNQAKEQANTLQNVADDHDTLAQATQNVNDALASGNPDALNNLPVATFKTPQAYQSYMQTVNQAQNTLLGVAAVQHKNALAAAQTANIQTQTDAIKGLADIGANPSDYYVKGADGQPMLDVARANQAINAFKMSQSKNLLQAKSDIEVQAEKDVNAAKTQGIVDVYNAKGLAQQAADKTRMMGLRTSLNDATKALVEAQKTRDAATIAAAQERVKQAQTALDLASGAINQGTPQPVPNASNPSTQWFMSLPVPLGGQ